MAESFQGTNLGSFKSGADDLDSLIKATLEENKKPDVAPKASTDEQAQTFKATHVNLAPAPKPVQEAIKQPAPIAQPRNMTTGKPVQVPAAKTDDELAYEATFKTYKIGDVVKGTVLKIDPTGALVDIKYKSDAFIPSIELSDKSFSNINDIIKVGDKIEVLIEKLEDKEGYIVASKRKADHEVKWRIAFDAFKSKKAIEAKVTGAVKGGLVVDYYGIRGFIPASQVAKETEESFDSFVGKTLPIKIIEINRRQGKVVMSHKMAAGEILKPDAAKLIEDLDVGQTRHGKVTSLKSFGAFVDIGGIEGLVHITELAWKRVKHPSDLLKVGQEIDVFVLGVDRESKKVALGLKQLEQDPWIKAAELYKPGMIVKAKIARFVKFGAFAELDGNLEGLIHISELSDKPITKPEEAVNVDDVVDVKVLKVIADEQKIGLSIKEVKRDAARKEIAEQKAAEDPKVPVTIGDVMKEKNVQI